MLNKIPYVRQDLLAPTRSGPLTQGFEPKREFKMLLTVPQSAISALGGHTMPENAVFPIDSGGIERSAPRPRPRWLLWPAKEKKKSANLPAETVHADWIGK